MNLLFGCLGPRSSRILLLLFIIQSTYLLHHYTADQARTQRVTAEKHNSAAQILSNNVTIQDFGLMGKKVAALADLAEHYVENSSPDASQLSKLITEQFPWWNESALPYFPWKYKPWQSRPLSDIKLFGPKTGIVIPAGDGNAREAAHLIAHLRNVHKSKLPIDIAYAGDSDMSPKIRRFLSQLGEDIHFIDLTKVFDDKLIHLGGWATKPFALLASRYPQTIMMDADAVFFDRPENLFNEFKSLQDTGALMFHDRSMDPGGPTRQDWLDDQLQAAGQRPSAHLANSSLFYRRYIGEEADAAVVCIDKSRPKMYMAMVFACWMNVQEVRDAVTYSMWFGEKESYWLAPELIGIPYSFESWSSARLAVVPFQETGVKMELDDTFDSAEWRTARGRRGSWEERPGPDVTTGLDESPPTDRRCTTHMVHATASGSEPLWANGGLWLDKRGRDLGLANWTHWYLGEPIAKALHDWGADTTGPVGIVSSGGAEETDQVEQQERRQQIMNTQPNWLYYDWGQDARGCPQHDETRWRRLSPDFKTRLEGIIEAVRNVDAMFELEFP